MEEQDRAAETEDELNGQNASYEGGEATHAETGQAGARASDQKSWKSTFKEYAEAIITAIVLALIIRAFVVQAFKIPSGSMLETLQIGDHLLVNKFLYGLDLPFTDERIFAIRAPEGGDIVVFKYPEDPRRDFIKRVIASGGQTVEGRDRLIYVDGKPVPEPYIKHTETIILPGDVSKRDNFGLIRVPEGKVFVMGDNRENSHDSRFWGFVDFKDIRGKAFIIYWSQDGGILYPRWGRIGDLLH
ncbi:MAG: signal peptidase I [Thermodesulfovibrionales bacterium]|nr:signal peptidase I [Thermodesulfovibrionales bacterium]